MPGSSNCVMHGFDRASTATVWASSVSGGHFIMAYVLLMIKVINNNL